MNLTLTGSIKLNRHKKIVLLRFRLSFERYFAVWRKFYAVSGLINELTFDLMFVVFFNSLFNLQYVPCFHLIRWRSVVYNTNEPHASCIYSILNAADFRESFGFNLHGKLIDKKNFRFLRRVCQEPSLFSVKRKGKNLSS